MEHSDDRPQIGQMAVDTASLDHDGMELSKIVSELGLQLAGDLPVGVTRRGWRVLASQNGEATTLGAPADEDRQRWWVGHISNGIHDPAPPSVRINPTTLLRRPSRTERSRGLALRWPDVTRTEPDLDLLAIDIVNEGSARWHPQGDSFLVFAAFRQPGGPVPPVYFAYVSGQSPALPLDPGEYARVRVVIDANQWATVQPGRYEVYAALVDLGPHTTEPLVVDVTAHNIQLHEPQRPAPGPPAHPW